jgi:leucine dehydrogenase
MKNQNLKVCISQNSELVLEVLSIPDYEKVVKITHQKSNLTAIIAIHNTSLGKALGGTRIYPYSSFDQALNDVLRLSKGMSYKSAVAGTGFGGGKAVIMANPETDKTEELLLAYADAVNQLNGEFITAEDSGSGEDDLVIMSQNTKYIAGLPHKNGSGNPSRFTAWGTYRGIQAVLKKIYGSDSVKNRKIVIQGVGCVGEFLTDFLFWEGADITVTDINVNSLSRVAKKYAVKTVHPNEIYSQECDVFCPCALGGTINGDTIPLLQCKAVAGAANNQLLSDGHADELRKRKILYAPDFVINSGGVINVAMEMDPDGYNPKTSQQKGHEIYDTLLTIFDTAEKDNKSTHQVALDLAEHRIKNKIGKKSHSPCFHCIEF